MKKNEVEDEIKLKRIQKVKDEKKPAIIIQVPGFGNMNSGPITADNDILEEDENGD